VAEALLRKRVSAVESNLPVVRNAEKVLFRDAAQQVIDDYAINQQASIAVVTRRIRKHRSFGCTRQPGLQVTMSRNGSGS
jgi:hypothetical protein